VVAQYVPERGDLVWLTFSPQSGHEQAGRRPGIVLSPASYNRRAGLALFCPITSKSKGYPFEVAIPEGLKVSGVVLSDQLRSLDWQVRSAEFADKAPVALIEEVIGKASTLLRG
jgi:mRNA interferase MazF